MINERGQAFMTFKILIAAIVAMAILALLLPMITNLSGLIGEKPGEEIQRMANNAINNLGSRESKQIAFSGGLALVPETVATKLGYTEKNVCFQVHDIGSNDNQQGICGGNASKCDSTPFAESSSAGKSSPGEIVFTSNNNLNVKVTVGCSSGGNASKISNVPICGCETSSGVCCGIFIQEI